MPVFAKANWMLTKCNSTATKLSSQCWTPCEPVLQTPPGVKGAHHAGALLSPDSSSFYCWDTVPTDIQLFPFIFYFKLFLWHLSLEWVSHFILWSMSKSCSISQADCGQSPYFCFHCGNSFYDFPLSIRLFPASIFGPLLFSLHPLMLLNHIKALYPPVFFSQLNPNLCMIFPAWSNLHDLPCI